MKNFIVIALLFCSTVSQSQDVVSSREKLGKFGAVTLTFNTSVEKGKTTKYFFLSFQNLKYRQIVDIGGVLINDIDKLNILIVALNQAAGKCKSGVDGEWNINKKPTIAVQDYHNYVVIYDGDNYKTRKYCHISLKKTLLLADKLSTEKYRLE